MGLCLPDVKGGTRCPVTAKRCRTKAEAHDWLVRYKRESQAATTHGRRSSWPRLYPYECSACGHWHVTKQKPKRKR